MSLVFQAFLAVFSALLVVGVFLFIFWRPLFNIGVDSFIKRLMKDPYPENLFEMYNVFRKIGVQNVIEADFRANQGKPLQRPFGTPRRLSPWNDLLLSPVYLSRFPLMDSEPVSLQSTIGPQAKRPMTIEIPIMIGGMAYGLGPSLKAKIALAKGADMMNTATNTGVGPFLPEERKHTKRLIIQYHRGNWGKEEEVLRQADAIEIQMGYGALGSAPVTLSPADISPEFRDYINLKPGQSICLDARLPNVTNGTALKKLVVYLQNLTGGVPVGVKIGATHHLEEELEIITQAPIDFLSVDGAEAGINFGPGILEDDLGLPTLAALCRTATFLKKKKLDDRITLIISGGLTTPGHFLKALALGAGAVYIGTIAMIVLAHTQLSKVIPWEPPTELVYERGKFKDKLVDSKSAQHLANYLKSCRDEMMIAMRTLGRKSLKDLSISDLCAISPEVADLTGVESGLFTPGEKAGSS